MGSDADWLVVDALNVIGARPTGWWRDRAGAVRELVDRLARLSAAGCAAPITVVIDGRALADLPEGSHGRLEVCYAPGGRDAADDRIVALLRERGTPARVVTADRALRERVEALGGATSSPSQLLRRLDRL